MLRRLVREPLVHFFFLAALIFAAYGLFSGAGEPAEDSIDVSRAKIEQLAGLFARVWQRPPTQAELKGLIDDHVKEEIYVREAIRLGLDRDDTVIRRRLRLKMEFLEDAAVEATPPTEAELEAYLERNADKFRRPPQYAFEQVYVDAERRGENARSEAEAILASLRGETAEAGSAGDATLLPARMALSGQGEIASIFGGDFAEAIASLSPGEWLGPVPSAIGFHLVRVTDRIPARLPPLAEIRNEAEREWINERRQAAGRERLDELLKRYKVSIEPLNAAESAPQ